MKKASFLRVVLLCVCALHQRFVVSQCTTNNCYGDDGEKNISRLTAMVSRLHDTVERQQVELTEMKEDLARLIKKELSETKTPLPTAHDCEDLLNVGHRTNGVYDIYLPKEKTIVKVYCDMTTDGGGWLVIQRRLNGSVDFYRDWKSYKKGFGNLRSEFWLGNEHLHYLTSYKNDMLRIDLGDFNRSSKYATYSFFGISAESDNYRLTLGQYSGTAGDSLTYHANKPFSTKDRDNDKRSNSCSDTFKGGWWYYDCHFSNLNGQYLQSPSDPHAFGLVWFAWHGWNTSLKTVKMRIRP